MQHVHPQLTMDIPAAHRLRITWSRILIDDRLLRSETLKELNGTIIPSSLFC